MTNNQEKPSLRKIPNVGSQTEQDLIAMGYTCMVLFYPTGYFKWRTS